MSREELAKLNSHLPIGVFDSGIGGLTVLKVLLEKFPNESFLYLGDTARLPYGAKSGETIYKYSDQTIRFLMKLGVKAIVIACNSASSHYPRKDINGVPIYNVIDPGAQTAFEKSETGRIGVLGTRATIQSGSYTRALKNISDQLQVFSQACPLFVPFAEEGLDNDPLTNLLVYRYLQPILQENVDTLILGCTHYPILKNSIQKAVGNHVTLVDSGHAISELLQRDMSQHVLEPNSETHQQSVVIMTTDHSTHFEKMAEQILETDLDLEFKWVDLNQ